MTATNYVAEQDFRRLNPVTVPSTSSFGPVGTRTFFAGDVIYRRGDKALKIYRIDTGAVRVYRVSPSGCRNILAFHSAGEWFGLEASGHHEDYAEAICETRLHPFSTSGSMPLPVNLLDLCLRNLSFAYVRQSLIVRPTAVARVAGFIEEEACKSAGGGPEFELLMSRADIADYLGLTVESVARAFTRLSSRRIIRLDGRLHRRVRILDPSRLIVASL